MGGVLALRAADLLADPMIWGAHEAVLRERRLGPRIRWDRSGSIRRRCVRVPVQIQVRVVPVGTPDLYDAARCRRGFSQLFRLKVEVDPVIERTRENCCSLTASSWPRCRSGAWGSSRGKPAPACSIWRLAWPKIGSGSPGGVRR